MAIRPRERCHEEIAERLAIKTGAVDPYVGNAMAKLDARSRAEAVHIALWRGIIVPDE